MKFITVNRKDFKKYLKEPETIPDDEIGFIKSNYWQYEKEYRFCWKGVSSNGDKREIFINLESLEKIEIFYFPTEKVMEVYKKEDLQKVVPIVAVCIFLVLLFSLIGSVNKV